MIRYYYYYYRDNCDNDGNVQEKPGVHNGLFLVMDLDEKNGYPNATDRQRLVDGVRASLHEQLQPLSSDYFLVPPGSASIAKITKQVVKLRGSASSCTEEKEGGETLWVCLRLR